MDGETAAPLRGSAARIVENMEASLQVPTATSVRTVAAKLLEVNRQILNNHLNRVGHGKVSFTHLIAFAIAKAVQADAGDELRLRRRRRQADGRAPRAPQPRARGRRRAPRRLALAARPEHQARRRARLRDVLRRVRRADPQGAHEQAGAGRLRRHDGHDHQPGDDRHRALGAAPHAGPGLHHRRRHHRLPGRVRGRGPVHGRPARGEQGVHAHEHVRPPHHRWRRERRVPPLDAPVPARRGRLLRRDLPELRRAVRTRRAGARTSARSTTRTPRSRRSSTSTSSSTCTGCAAT